MTSTQVNSQNMKLEVLVLPVSDVDRAKDFYKTLGWRLDADFVVSENFRVVQFTPPGSKKPRMPKSANCMIPTCLVYST